MYASPMPLVYLPDVEALFLWGSDAPVRSLPALGHGGEAATIALVVPDGVAETPGLKLPLVETLTMLAVVPAADVDTLPGSVATYVLASKLAILGPSRIVAEPGIPSQPARG